jgi:hypothetical protein
VFINEKSMFTITKWVKIAGDPKIVNLIPARATPFQFNPTEKKQKADG